MTEANDAAIMPVYCESRPRDVVAGRTGFLWVAVASWLFPRCSAIHSRGWSLLSCFLVHLVAALIGGLAIAGAMIAWHESPKEVIEAIADFVKEFLRSPAWMTLFLLGTFLLIEGGVLGLAAVVTSWGASGGERLRDSLGHSLRQVWLRTPHAVVVVALTAFLGSFIITVAENWRHDNSAAINVDWPMPPDLPTVPLDDPGYLAAKKKYDQEFREFEIAARKAEQVLLQHQRQQPWYVRLAEPICIALGVVSAGWWLAALLRAVGVERSPRPAERTTHCLWCGYDLNMTPMEGRCPECGEQVSGSIGAGAQPGPVWEQRRSVGLVTAWWRTWRPAVRYPALFGRSLRNFAGSTGHRRFLIFQLLLIFLLGAAGIVILAITTSPPELFIQDFKMLCVMGTIFGTVCVLGSMLVVCGTASLVGGLISLQNRRNLLPVASQMAVYCSPYLVAWAFLGAVLFVSGVNLNISGYVPEFARLLGMHPDFLFFLWFFVPNIICALVFVGLVARGVLGARHANR